MPPKTYGFHNGIECLLWILSRRELLHSPIESYKIGTKKQVALNRFTKNRKAQSCKQYTALDVFAAKAIFEIPGMG